MFTEFDEQCIRIYRALHGARSPEDVAAGARVLGLCGGDSDGVCDVEEAGGVGDASALGALHYMEAQVVRLGDQQAGSEPVEGDGAEVKPAETVFVGTCILMCWRARRRGDVGGGDDGVPEPGRLEALGPSGVLDSLHEVRDFVWRCTARRGWGMVAAGRIATDPLQAPVGTGSVFRPRHHS